MAGILRGLRDARLLGVIGYALVAGALAAGGTAVAQDEKHLTEYRAFVAALDAGDRARATVHALSAWHAAEAALGDDPQTATLAYNYARLVLFDDADRAGDALRRVNDLQEAGVSSLDAGELQIYSAYADFVVSGLGRRKADRLLELLTAWDASRNLGSDLIVMWLNLGQAYLADRKLGRAEVAAERTEAVILETMPDNVHFRAQAVMINGIAHLLTRRRPVARIEVAYNEFVRAALLFPPQKDLESLDPLLAQIIAWWGAATAALKYKGRDPVPPPPHALFAHGYLADCAEIEWVEISEPHIPYRDLRRATIGAVYIDFAVGDDLRVQDARVLAEVPESRFGEVWLEEITEWRAESPPPGDCRRSHFVFAFAFD